ncbi:protein lethal(2)essential for life [Microplitis demolitor]|uniref:protein lethal(2)essential for life n=1 Tax=Microplitis demolitor TaxID=69319 RepID=UPI0004CD90A2|nr:protein lethal(2)essential for life [Microplitis demolitor]
MALVPLLFSNWWEDLEAPHRLLDQDFGSALTADQLLTPSILERYLVPRALERRRSPLAYYRPWAELLRRGDTGSSTVKADKDRFQVILDVQQFKPEEINVKVVDKCVVVEAKHEEKQDEHGWISRQFVRKYMIPEQCDIDQVNSSLSSDGVLTITAPRKDVPKLENERQIKIEHTGKPAIRESCEKESCAKDVCAKECKKDDKKTKK